MFNSSCFFFTFTFYIPTRLRSAKIIPLGVILLTRSSLSRALHFPSGGIFVRSYAPSLADHGLPVPLFLLRNNIVVCGIRGITLFSSTTTAPGCVISRGQISLRQCCSRHVRRCCIRNKRMQLLLQKYASEYIHAQRARKADLHSPFSACVSVSL